MSDNNKLSAYDYDHVKLRLAAQIHLLGVINEEISAIAVHINKDTIEMTVFASQQLHDTQQEEVEYALLMIQTEMAKSGIINEKLIVKIEDSAFIESGFWVYAKYGIKFKGGVFDAAQNV